MKNTRNSKQTRLHRPYLCKHVDNNIISQTHTSKSINSSGSLFIDPWRNFMHFSFMRWQNCGRVMQQITKFVVIKYCTQTQRGYIDPDVLLAEWLTIKIQYKGRTALLCWWKKFKIFNFLIYKVTVPIYATFSSFSIYIDLQARIHSNTLKKVVLWCFFL